MIRSTITKAALRLLTRYSPATGLYRSRIWTGPLRGMAFSTPRRERLSFALGTYERDLVQLALDLSPRDATVVDVGANAGYFTLALACAVGPLGRVLAFEPDPQNLCALEQNLADNAIQHVTVCPAAVADRPGEVLFSSFPYSLVGHLRRPDDADDAVQFKVPVTTLDAVFAIGKLPALVKIDVEGAELAVFRGGQQLFAQRRTTVLAEVRSEYFTTINDLMRDAGYTTRVLTGGWDLSRDGLADVLFTPKP